VGHLDFSQDIDRRSTGYRRFKVLATEIAHDLGGLSALTILQRRLLQHCAALSVYIESEEVRLLSGESLKYPDLFVAAGNSFRRLAASLGWQRLPAHQGAAALRDYIHQVAARSAAAGEQEIESDAD
jgi:hypothetical protein